MSELADYRVETDQTVLLVYQDGTQLRVPTHRLAKYLHGDELARVRQALNLRRMFLRDHLPKSSLVIGLAVALLAVGITGNNRLAGKAQVAPPVATSSVMSVAPATTLPEPTGEVAGAATVAPVATAAAVETAPPPATTPPVSTPSSIAENSNPVTKVVKTVTKAVTEPVEELFR